MPSSLLEAGVSLWQALWTSTPWLDPDQHGLVVEEVCHLADEMDGYRHAIDRHGVLLVEPIVTPTGAVVGERLTANPAEAMLRRAGTQLEKLLAVLGLTPAARARLGLEHLSARRTQQRIELTEREIG